MKKNIILVAAFTILAGSGILYAINQNNSKKHSACCASDRACCTEQTCSAECQCDDSCDGSDCTCGCDCCQ